MNSSEVMAIGVACLAGSLIAIMARRMVRPQTGNRVTWEEFLDGLSTPGGCIFLLSLFVCLFSIALLHIMHHPTEISQTMSTTFTNILMALVGALVQALQSRARPPGTNGNGTVTTTTDVVQHVETVKPPPTAE